MLSYFSNYVPKVTGPAIWIHAVSVGETKAAAPLIRRLKQQYPGHTIVMSSVTKTGKAEVERNLPEVDHSIFLPLDVRAVMKRAVAKVKPELLIVVETDYWYNLMDQVKRQGGKVVVVNGKLSEKSARRYHHLSPLAGPLFGSIDRFCVQDYLYYDRFREVGVHADQIVVTGNLKLDARPTAVAPIDLALKGAVVTIGSTHDPEERKLLSDLKGVDATILLVPRHPERFDKVADWLKEAGFRYGRYSQKERLKGDEEVILIDEMGVLLRCYRASQVAIVAGSFTERVGGHNVIEPMMVRVPVIFGPHMQSQRTLAELALSHGAALQVSRVREAVETLLEDPIALIEGGRRLLAATEGSLDKTWAIVDEALAQKERA